ncbi:MAG: PDC sensor domain-containing protein [Gammaproteobacteria bacterium]|nr:PDC sensor domain-containing protein [Gammaproteobacteria bacterium]MCW8911504.1 PDC sensor domain-containing protein [Gammaproteobacteria bacterium]
MKTTWKEAVHQQRVSLAERLSRPLAIIASHAEPVWGDREALNKVLLESFSSLHHALFIYALDTGGIQISDNVSAEGLLTEHFGRDRSSRPYMTEAVPSWGFLLSEAYLSLRANRPSITALQIVRRGDQVLGYIGADFDLRDLPVTAGLYDESAEWRQIKGDPAIRGGVFAQCRTESSMDIKIDVACAIIEELITERGMFQTVIHFSSSRATAWFMSDPYRYRMLDAEALGHPDVCLLYPAHAYPEDALIPQDRISSIMKAMKKLRLTDETFYLRSASINIFNGMISLTFSCDGSHYMSWREFLDKDETFWFGAANKK